MTKENVKTSDTDVMQAMVEFLSVVTPEEVQEMPATFQFMFELELETQNMDSKSLRLECLNALRTLRMLTDQLKPFSKEDFLKAEDDYVKQQKCCKNV